MNHGIYIWLVKNKRDSAAHLARIFLVPNNGLTSKPPRFRLLQLVRENIIKRIQFPTITSSLIINVFFLKCDSSKDMTHYSL